MRPDVYPRTLENVRAVLLYYFPKISHTEIDKNAERVYDERKMKLNELEYACEVISRNKKLVEKNYNMRGLNIYLMVAYEVLFGDETTWGDGNRREKLKAVKENLIR